MKTGINLLIILAVIASALGAASPAPAGADQAQVYVELGLYTAESDTLSVIVTAGDSAAAARAVERLGGQVSSELWLIDAVAASIPADGLQALAGTPGLLSIVHNKGVESADRPIDPNADSIATPRLDPAAWEGWVTSYRFPVPWDGTPDVEPTNNKGYYNFVTLVAVDTRVNALQERHNLWGYGVTVAVVDSGVYVSDQTKSELGMQTLKQFRGQADFVQETCASYTDKKNTYTEATQYNDHCFTELEHSRDGYGHGSHVAGIIWSNLGDWDTGGIHGSRPQGRHPQRARAGRRRHGHLRGRHPGHPVRRRATRTSSTSGSSTSA